MNGEHITSARPQGRGMNGENHTAPPPGRDGRGEMNGEQHTAPPPGGGREEGGLRPPPNRRQNHDNHYQRYQAQYSSSSRASFKGCCCCLFLLLTFLGLLLLAVILVIVLAVKPKKPQFDLQQVSVQFVGIAATNPTPTTPSSVYLSLTIKMVFTAVNPNKVGIKYSDTEFYVMYKGVPLGVASVHGFYQPAHSIRQVETTVSVQRVNLLQADATDLLKDANLNDRVELKVIGDVGAKIRILDFTSPRVKVSVDCAIVISPRRSTLTYKQCGVDGLTVR